MPQVFAFVSADSFGMLRGDDRKFIRRHCMIGRNKKKSQDALASEQRQATCDSKLGTQSLSIPLQDPAPSNSVLPCESIRWDAWIIGVKAGEVRISREAAQKDPIDPIPPPVNLLPVKFAVEVDRQSRELLFKFFNSVTKFAYPVDSCVDFDISKALWSRWIEVDTAYLHAVLLGASVINDYHLDQPPAKATYYHLRKTIAILNQHLSDSVAYLWDSTVAVVVILAMLADVFGDYGAVKAHIAGLEQIICLRGGLESFRENTKLQIKIRLLDLYLSLQTGEQPHFFPDRISWVAIFKSQSSLSTTCKDGYSCRVQSVDYLQDGRLTAVFRDLQCFVGLMNAAVRSHQRLRDTDFQSYTFSIQYRLLQLQGELENILSECLRLAMLSFIAITFPLPGRPARYPYLASHFRECCCAIDATAPSMQNLMLWFLIVSAISIYDDDVPWLRERWQMVVPRMEWREAQQRLQDVMWIDAIHDRAGRQAFDTMSRREGA